MIKGESKSALTAQRILDAALESFRTEGFDGATMRGIATKAGVATGAAYYYYSSKDAIVLDFYRRAAEELRPRIEAALEGAQTLEARLRALVGVKLEYFAPNRTVLRALLRGGADPKYPLSPFSAETRDIRDADLAWFRLILTDCGIRIPKDLAPHLPGVLWFFQMGVILFWVIDESERQLRSAKLLDLSAKIVAGLVKVSALPFMRTIRKTALELIGIVQGV